MRTSQFPSDFIERFSRPGSTAQIANHGNPMVEPEDQFIQEGEVASLSLDGETLCIRFAWIARRDIMARTWHMHDDPTLLVFEQSLDLFDSGGQLEDGRFQLLPLEPVVHEHVLFMSADYSGPSGRTPLKRSEVLPAKSE